MNPLLMSALISGGINALQGKRGSNLLKSTIMDTAMSAALMGGTNLAMGQPANPFAKDLRSPKYKKRTLKSRKIYDRKKKNIT